MIGAREAEALRTRAFFTRLSAAYPVRRPAGSVVVAHMVTNSVHFVPIIDSMSPVQLLLPKPSTADPLIREDLTARFPSHELSRNWARDASSVLDELDRRGVTGDVVFVDIGGYFAESINLIAAGYRGGRVLGCMEGTENGVAKYAQRLDEISVPVAVVADSRLKYPENHLVGVSVVHSVESVIRDLGEVLQQYRACVIGFGKVGRSVAEALRGRGIPTAVFDHDPVAAAEAAARGFIVHRELYRSLGRSNLVICATGNKSLGPREFPMINAGSLIATVTSADDEFDTVGLETGWVIERTTTRSRTSITQYRNETTSFSILNDGNTVNFLHGAVIGPAIQLIEGEKLVALHNLIENFNDLELHSLNRVSDADRRIVAETWLDHFLMDE